MPLNLPAVDQEILARWRRDGTFAQSLRQTAGGPRWTLWEGPSAAHGMPGLHHLRPQVVKDLFGRFKTMQGFHVARPAGWDCHGLAVEVAVERELGLAGARDIEAYGVAAFNARCRESARRHMGAFRALSERIGHWTDFAGAYQTMDAAYVESAWGVLKAIHDQGRLVRESRVSPYCPRCGTVLAEHETGQPGAYRTVTGPSATVRLTVTAPPAGSANPGVARHLRGADLLVWTTAPWTLVASTAVAVHPDATYLIARKSRDGDKAVVAESCYARVLGEGWHVLAQARGHELAGSEYAAPCQVVEVPGARVIVTAGFVTARAGTGLVHLAPAFGASDLAAARAHGLPVVSPVGPDGRFAGDLPLVGGLLAREADQPVLADLAERGLLYGRGTRARPARHCWRCGTALLPGARPSWYIKATEVKPALLAGSAQAAWHPPASGRGQFGPWLAGSGDWAVSRARYWGTPLPLWECDRGHVTCVGSLAELGSRAGADLSALDPHRPFVDDVTFGCPQCPGGALARRVPEVADAWFDAGVAPFARPGAPGRPGGEAAEYPAQLACEASDRARGWCYALLAVGTLVRGRPPWEDVACPGPVMDEQGRPMSPRLGNVLEPTAVLDARGADAVRWFLAGSGSPWGPRRIGPAGLDEVVRTVLLRYWNVAAILPPPAPGPAPDGTRSLLDRWLLGEVSAAVTEVTAALEAFDSAAAGRRLAALLGDLANWYVRRARGRLRAGPSTADGAAAVATLRRALLTVTRLMAPLAPFLADYAWGHIRTAGEPASVHLASWPADEELPARDPVLAGQMALARRLAGLGRAARATAGVPARQPLARALAGAVALAALPGELRDLVAAELNVGRLELLPAGELVTYQVRPQFRALGRRFGPRTPAVAEAARAADPAALAAGIAGGGSFTLPVPGLGPVPVTAADVTVTAVPAAAREAGPGARRAGGWAVATGDGATVALDVTLTPALRAEGLARAVTRQVQQARQAAGLAVTARVRVRWLAAGPELAAALGQHGELIAAQVRAASFEPAGPGGRGDRDDASGPDGSGSPCLPDGSGSPCLPGDAGGQSSARGAGDAGDAGDSGDSGGAGDSGDSGGAGDSGAGWREHRDDGLGLRFWLAPASPAG